MRTVHELRLRASICDSVARGKKPFVVSRNDCEFQTGDYLKFCPVTDAGVAIVHAIQETVFQITYVQSGSGIQEGWVVLGIKKLKSDSRRKL